MATQYDVRIDDEFGYEWDGGYRLKEDAFASIDKEQAFIEVPFTTDEFILVSKSRLVVVEATRTVVDR